MPLGLPKTLLELIGEEQFGLAGFAASCGLPHTRVARSKLVLWSYGNGMSVLQFAEAQDDDYQSRRKRVGQMLDELRLHVITGQASPPSVTSRLQNLSPGKSTCRLLTELTV
jgi:hypothetical protein